MADETQETPETTETNGLADASNEKPNTGDLPAMSANAGQAGVSPAQTGAPDSSSRGAPLSSPAPSGNISADMQKILTGIKLPERRDGATSIEKKPIAQTRDIDAILAAPTPEQAPAPTPPPQPKDPVQSLHTLKNDLQQVVHDQKISVVKAAALEQDKTRGAADAMESRPRSNRVKNVMFGALLLLFLGGAALGGVYVVVQSNAEPLPEEQTNSLVFAEQTVPLNIDGQTAPQLKAVIAEARTSSNASLGTITRIAPVTTSIIETGEVTRLATLPEFFTAIDALPPEDLMRALSQEFFFGLHTVDRNAPLIVIPVLSYERAFSGMLSWEKTINGNLAPIYARVPDLVAGENGIPRTRTFVDDVMRNYDVRILKNDAGETVLYWAFPSRSLLVIAESPYTFTELLSRLQSLRSI